MLESKITSLETYLAQIARELRDLPAQARADEMREIESHLDALIQVGQQLEELSETEAIAVALKQFGEPRKIGRKLRKAWERQQPEPWWCAAQAAFFAVNFFVMIVHPLMLGFTTFDLGAHGATLQPDVSFATTQQMLALSENIGIFLLSILAFLTLFATYVTSLISPKRGKEILALMIILGFGALLSDPDNLTVFTGISMLNTAICALIGSHFGAIHGRRWLSRRADARDKADANPLIS